MLSFSLLTCVLYSALPLGDVYRTEVAGLERPVALPAICSGYSFCELHFIAYTN